MRSLAPPAKAVCVLFLFIVQWLDLIDVGKFHHQKQVCWSSENPGTVFDNMSVSRLLGRFNVVEEGAT